VQDEITTKGGKDQGAATKHLRGPEHENGSSCEKTLYLIQGANGANMTRIFGKICKMSRWTAGRKEQLNWAKVGPGRLARPTPGTVRCPLSSARSFFDSKLLATPPFAKNEGKYWEGRPQSKERLDQKKPRDTLVKTIHPSPRRQSEVKDEVEALPRRPQSWRKTLLECLPWSTVPCLASCWGKLSICPWGCNGSRHVSTDSFIWFSIYCSCWWCLDT
jgi:hypothetical protein